MADMFVGGIAASPKTLCACMTLGIQVDSPFIN